MIISGIYWRTQSKKSDLIDRLSCISQKYFPAKANLVSTNSLTIITGKISRNDYDELLVNDDNIIVGRLFNKINSQPLKNSHLNKLTVDKIVSEWWGKYIFFSHNEKETTTVSRDPTGQLPFFYHELKDGNILFSSELSILCDFLPTKLAYNWPYVLSNITYNNNSNSDQTIFEDVFELPPGCLLEFNEGMKVRINWNPLNYSATRSFNSSEFISVLNSCLKAWNDCYDNLVLSFSGGLDSTALFYCLDHTKNENQTLKAINFFHPKIKSSNELNYARKISADLGIELIELDVEEALPFTPLRGTLPMKPNRALPALTHMALMERVSEIVNKKPSSLFINGQGGDHIFLANPPFSLILDYFIDKGFQGIKSQMDSLTHYYRTTMFQVIKYNLRAVLNQFRYNRNVIYNQNTAKWMSKSFYKIGQNQYLHPIHQNLPKSMRLGKLEHIIEIDNGFASIALELGDHNPVYSPLLYQPLVELALSVPTYEMLKDGYDRYPMRNSISRYFNTEHVWRRSKGETTGIIQLGVKKNLEYIKMLCLEGKIAQKGLVNKKILEEEIVSLARGSNESLWLLMNLISTEIFFEIWE